MSLLDKNEQLVWEKKYQHCRKRELSSKDNQFSIKFVYVSPDKKNGLIDPIYQHLYSRFRIYNSDKGPLSYHAIFEHARLLLIIQPEEENLLNIIGGIKLEYAAN